jgi:hypothetical protein
VRVFREIVDEDVRVDESQLVFLSNDFLDFFQATIFPATSERFGA